MGQQMSPESLNVEIAVEHYVGHRLSLGKASEIAGLSLWQFRQLLGERQIPVHYDPEDVQEDVVNLRELGLID
jgi:predicted HTH domain antitoxin